MFGRGWLFLLLLAGTVAVPYVASNSSNLRESVADLAPTLAGDDEATEATTVASSAPAATADTAAGNDAASTVTTAAPPRQLTDVAEMAEVFRLDVTPVWVMNRWTRVSTQLSSLDGHGYRVPLVTGSGEDDLAGALTYYFTPEHRLRRITFSGTTGDPRRLVWLLNNRFGFQQRITPGAATFSYEAKLASDTPSTLRISPVHIVRADAPRARYSVELDMHSGA